MYRAMPVIQESAQELKARMRRERHGQKRQRLQMLYLIASGQARTRTALAPLLGVNRETVGDWLRLYADGGLSALLTIRTPPGKAPTIPPAVLDELRERLSQPDGMASYDEIRIWLATQHGIQMSYKAVAQYVHRKLKTRPKVVRPRHIKTLMLTRCSTPR
ncbi:helix-turn-helix domain-containing protein [Chloroflexus sp.]|uniref:helix-turn-helix domain-containing protein n=1 Tax=Chloroflexus sp. TaxID=1904827 RepID=UPI00257DDA34|nr:helix-turn-helix domain-containing protein [Chloroflexus sp.]